MLAQARRANIQCRFPKILKRFRHAIFEGTLKSSMKSCCNLELSKYGSLFFNFTAVRCRIKLAQHTDKILLVWFKNGAHLQHHTKTVLQIVFKMKLNINMLEYNRKGVGGGVVCVRNTQVQLLIFLSLTTSAMTEVPT